MQKLEVGQTFEVYRVESNEQDESCIIGNWYPKYSTYNDCAVLVNFNEPISVYMYDDEIKHVATLKVTKVKI